MFKNRAFTLTELLISIGIIGTVAALSIPALMTNINNRMLATQIKNMTGSIQQIATDQLVIKNTRTLKDTDFNDSSKLLTNSYFQVTKTCAASSYSQCWPATTYKSVSGGNSTYAIPNSRAVKLKNGAALTYKILTNSEKSGLDAGAYSMIVIDVNGNDLPNIVGRDLFAFYLTENANILGMASSTSAANKSSACRNTPNPVACYDMLMENGWNMNY